MSFPLCLGPIIPLFNPARLQDGADPQVCRTVSIQSGLDPFLAGQNIMWSLFLLTLKPHYIKASGKMLWTLSGLQLDCQGHIVCSEQDYNSVAIF